MTYNNFDAAFLAFIAAMDDSINPAMVMSKETGEMSIAASPHDINRGTHIVLCEANNLLEYEHKAIQAGGHNTVLDSAYGIAAFHIVCYAENRQQESYWKSKL